MAKGQRIAGLSSLLLLLLMSACQSDTWDFTFIDIGVKVKDLPQDVVKAVDRNWPHAHIESVERLYGGDSWGDYALVLDLGKDRKVCPLLSKAGKVKSDLKSPCPG
jgi:hypothetical protein